MLVDKIVGGIRRGPPSLRLGPATAGLASGGGGCDGCGIGGRDDGLRAPLDLSIRAVCRIVTTLDLIAVISTGRRTCGASDGGHVGLIRGSGGSGGWVVRSGATTRLDALVVLVQGRVSQVAVVAVINIRGGAMANIRGIVVDQHVVQTGVALLHLLIGFIDVLTTVQGELGLVRGAVLARCWQGSTGRHISLRPSDTIAAARIDRLALIVAEQVDGLDMAAADALELSDDALSVMAALDPVRPALSLRLLIGFDRVLREVVHAFEFPIHHAPNPEGEGISCCFAAK